MLSKRFTVTYSLIGRGSPRPILVRAVNDIMRREHTLPSKVEQNNSWGILPITARRSLFFEPTTGLLNESPFNTVRNGYTYTGSKEMEVPHIHQYFHIIPMATDQEVIFVPCGSIPVCFVPV